MVVEMVIQDNKISWILLILAFIVMAVGCSPTDAQRQTTREWRISNGKVKVLSTIAMIDDLVKDIGGDFVDSITLIKGELDPHSYQLVKGDDEKLAFADIIFYNGLGLEHGPSLQVFLKKQNKAIPLGNRIMEENPSLLLYYKGQPDPHIWMEISIWAQTITHIVNALSIKDPLHAADYRKNGEKLAVAMLKAHREARQQLQSIPASKRYLVTSHDAFNYFSRAYLAVDGEDSRSWRERFAAPEGLAPESQIAPTDIQAIIDHLSRYNIHVIFPESNVNRDSIRKIVQAAKSKGLNVKIAEVVLYADAMGAPGSDSDTYIKMMQHNIKAIADNINGK
ncbi:MAG: zinc ABC transporter substrate-binding protein [Parachlamydiaceae bacterium]